jgi:hypothetical protein
MEGCNGRIKENFMTLKDLIKDANQTLGLPIDFNDTAGDDNYGQLFAAARLVLNTLGGGWNFTDGHIVNIAELGVSQSTLVYGILAEYAFVAGMLNEWKVWKRQYGDGLFKEKVSKKSRIMPRNDI